LARAPKSIQVITANRLLDGRVVFLTPSGTWDHDVAVATVYADPIAAEAGIAAAQKSAAAGEVVDPYAIAVSAEAGHIVPTVLRERIRAEGPTIPSDFRAA
jgi:hypothetical protein